MRLAYLSMACRGGCRAGGSGGSVRRDRGSRRIDASGAGDTVIRGSGILARGMRGGGLESLGAGAAVLALTRVAARRASRARCPCRRSPPRRRPRRPSGAAGAVGPGPAARRLHAAARRQRPRRAVRAAARLGRGAHHDRHPGPVRGAHRAARAARTRAPAGRRTTCSTSTSAPTPTPTPPPSSGGPTSRPRTAPHRDVALGDAHGVLVERPPEAVLHGRQRCRDADLRAARAGSGSATSRPATRWSTSPCGCCPAVSRRAARRTAAAPPPAPPDPPAAAAAR